MAIVTESERKDAAGKRPVRRPLLDPHSPGFASFADVLYSGVLVFATMLPLVTGFAGLSAAVQVFREARASDGHVTVGAFWRAFVDRVTKHWISHIVVPTVVGAVLVGYLLVLPLMGLEPWMAIGLPAVAGVIVGAIGLRFVGTWRQGTSARVTLAETWRRMSDDPVGTLLLAGAAFTAGAIVSFATMLLLVIAGPLVLAAVAVDRRYLVLADADS